MNIELQTAIAIQYSIKILKSVHDSQQKNKNIAKKITKYWHNVRISEIADIRFSRNFFPRRFPPFRTCTRNKLSLTCRQSLDHVTVTFLDALHKSAFFHQSFGRTLENTFASEKYKTPTYLRFRKAFLFLLSELLFHPRAFTRYTRAVVGMEQAHGLFFPFAPYVKSSLRRSGSGHEHAWPFSRL